MTTTDRPHNLTPDQIEYLKSCCRQLGGEIGSRNGATAALLYRAADQQLRGIKPRTLAVSFASMVAGTPGPTIGAVLRRASLARRESVRNPDSFGVGLDFLGEPTTIIAWADRV